MHNINILSDEENYPILLADAKVHLKVDTTDEDTYITTLIKSATQFVEEYCGISLTEKVIECYYQSLGDKILLPKPPLIELTKFYYYDDIYTEYEMPTASYKLIQLNTFNESQILLKTGATWGTYTKQFGIKLKLKVGFASTGTIVNPVPYMLKQELLNIIAYWYENRQLDMDIPEKILDGLSKYRLVQI